MAAGGQNSQLDVRRLADGSIVYKGHCGGSVNNALHIARDASQQVGEQGVLSAGAGAWRVGGWVVVDASACKMYGGAHAVERHRQEQGHSRAAAWRSRAMPPPLTCACLPPPHFPPTTLQLRLFVCNNNDTVKVYGLASGTLVTMLRCPVAINYCALSPSGR